MTMNRFLTAMLLCINPVVALAQNSDDDTAAGYSHRLDLQARFDDRSDRDHRNQYRIRYYPQWTFDDAGAWSVNSFVVTGDDFGSSHNTIGDGSSQKIYVRRAYVRHTSSWGKTEVGIVPTYKGRVSSSGLSKDGWIAGIRQVVKLDSDSLLDIVVGELDDTDPANALELPEEANYIELEYTTKINDFHSYELSLERMTGGNFLRGEYRYKTESDHTVFFELIRRLDEPDSKTVTGLTGDIVIGDTPLSYFAHYSYVSEGIGPRAELTEDFLGTGHGFSAEISGSINAVDDMEWFVRFDVVDSTTRLLSGIALSLDKN
ncbi:hypothetical protein [Alteromonas sp. H39]|uniref:hypothetical protein n=1 Tax=Alteromonas sp. H39 TaxID=3389876 RepID=UPI0039E171BD